jgi:hypothetical protein
VILFLNKIHNLDIGDFCKKSRNRSIFVFSCPNFGAYGFCISAGVPLVRSGCALPGGDMQ